MTQDDNQAREWHYIVYGPFVLTQVAMDWIQALVTFFVEHGIIRLFIVFLLGISIGLAVA